MSFITNTFDNQRDQFGGQNKPLTGYRSLHYVPYLIDPLTRVISAICGNPLLFSLPSSPVIHPSLHLKRAPLGLWAEGKGRFEQHFLNLLVDFHTVTLSDA